MTVQNLYTQYLDGKISKQKFLYEVRRDQNLTMISPNNSFDDVVKILKNRAIISEKAHKESTGKQDVEIIAKTIDMVNPYEYAKGMNYELEIMDIPASSGDLSDDNVLKAQKKVLANLTKNPQYYCEKLYGKNDKSDEWVEVTKKSIDAIGKGKASKVIREGSYSDAEDKLMQAPIGSKATGGGYGPFEKIKQNTWENPKTKSLQHSEALARHIGGFEDFKISSDKDNLEEIGMFNDPIGYKKSEPKPQTYTKKFVKATDKKGIYVYDIFKNGKLVKTIEGGEGDANAWINQAQRSSDKINEHGQYADRVADVNADSSPLNESEPTAEQIAIYEKYSAQTGIPVENLMSMVREAKKKVKEGTTYAGKDAVDDATKDPKFGSLSSAGKTDAVNKLKQGNTVTIG